MSKLLTKEIEKKLIKNYELNASRDGKVLDLVPVVKFFGGGSCTWLFTEYDPETRQFFGLCDIGHGFPELGYVDRDELESLRFPPFRLPVERDRYTDFDKKISEYARIARENGRIKL